jgi:hypothetical protein
MTELEAEIGAVLERYVSHWNDWEMDAVKGLWDPDEPEPIYVAEEAPAHIGWEALDRYWQVSEPGVQSTSSGSRNCGRVRSLLGWRTRSTP